MTDTQTMDGQPGARDRVLVVDDEPLIRWSVAETLKQQGFTVVEAGDAGSALVAATGPQAPFGVVVLDVRLPDSDGLDLLMQLRQVIPDARIVLMTAHGSPELARSALSLGAYWVLDKPFGMGDLEEVVEQASVARLPGGGGR